MYPTPTPRLHTQDSPAILGADPVGLRQLFGGLGGELRRPGPPLALALPLRLVAAARGQYTFVGRSVISYLQITNFSDRKY